MSRTVRILTAPIRAIQRFDACMGSPDAIDRAIAFCDALLPVIWIVAAGVLVGLVLGGGTAFLLNL